MDEFPSTRYTRKVRHDIIYNNQQEWECEPEKTIEDVVHNVLHLTDSQTQHDDRPTQLIQLEFDMSSLHRCDRQDEG